MVPVVKEKPNEELKWRKLTPIECERLQTVPDNYTNYVSNTQRYKMLGNSFTNEVIKTYIKKFDLIDFTIVVLFIYNRTMLNNNV